MTNDPERRARFEREAQTVAGLNHPNIVTVHSVEEDRGLHFMTMELVEGNTLAERIPRDGFSLGRLLEHAVPLAEAVSAAHEQGVTHRDLKPANVMIGADGRLRVLDFGLAKLHDAPQTDGGATQVPTQSITQDGRIIGTIAYMSPEQAESKSVDARSDVFSLGVVLYEMATGQRPFQGDTTVSTITSIMRDTPVSVTERNHTLPRHFGRVVRRCLAKDPRRRYQSAVELHNELRELKEELESGDIELSSTTQMVVVTKRPRWVWAVAALAIVALAAGLVGFWPEGEGRPDASQRMTVENLSNDGLTVSSAISPDGQYLARIVRTYPDFSQDRLLLRQLATGTEVEIVPPQQHNGLGQLRFTPDGSHVSYLGWDNLAKANLYRVSVLGGTPREIASTVELSGHSFSPDGKRVAFVRRSGKEVALVAATVDGSAEDQVLATRSFPELVQHPAWSSDGESILFSAWQPHPYSAEFRTVPATGGDERPLDTGRWFDLQFTTWLPDGTGFLATAFDRSPSVGGQVWLFSYPEGAARKITNDTATYMDLSVTGDGRTIVSTRVEWESGIWLTSIDEPEEGRFLVTKSTLGPGFLPRISWVEADRLVYATTDLRIWLAATDGGAPVPLSPRGAVEFFPDWIPGTDRLAFTSLTDGDWSCWGMDLDGGNRRPLVEGNCSQTAAGPKGEWVYYLKNVEGDNHLWRVPAGGGDPEQVDPRHTDGYLLAPDGNRVAVAAMEDLFRVARSEILSLDDGSATPAPFHPLVCGGWLPETDELVCSRGLWADLWASPLAGGEQRQLTEAGDDFTLSHGWSPDGRQVAFGRGHPRSDTLMIQDFR
jgi:serine/threonine protein kinase